MFLASAFFSFRIPIGTVGSEAVVIRTDDIVFVIITLLSVVKIRQYKQTSLDIPVAIFVIICILSIFNGVVLNTINSAIVSYLYLFKIIQYFLVFYFLFNYLADRKDARFFTGWILGMAFLVSIYGIWEHFFPYPHYPYSYPFFYRIYERGLFYHDASHISALLMFVASIVFGLFLYLPRKSLERIGLFFIFISLSLALLFTYTRSAYLALLAAILIISAMKGRNVFIITLVSFILFILLFAPQSVVDRVYSFKASLFGNNPNTSSVAYRLQQIKYSWETIKQYPLFGLGLGARERIFYENQFLMIICELGLVGFVSFCVICFNLFKTAVSLSKNTGSSLLKGLSLGYIGGLTGLLIMCNTLVAFLVSRITIPFWAVTAILFWVSKQDRGYEI